ncbi:monovalent cation:proton antiporter family protein [Thalassotalea sp. PS06]|uniref:monovalent cation:proton antiporter family protein n=1 Tax=Thalassotalea sp. PS06 TaxID=2594005 RepID=UPI001165A16C|nr:monovalent cation:proton antiporter family protein [Thalassotalea sp. PS06]QDP01867.1 potassium transporter [Thalassotalea sp. PS06]
MGNFYQVLAILVAAVVVVWLFRRWRLPAILAYLVAGTLIGEHGLNITGDESDYEHIAELGIVFLLFTLGLEFSLPKLLAMRHLVTDVGCKQVGLTLLIVIVLALLFGFSLPTAFVIGGVVALSSTAIVIRQLSESGSIKRRSGQISVAVLLCQDIAVVPFLILIPLLGEGADWGVLSALFLALVKGLFVVAVLLFAGRWLLPRIFNVVAQVRTDELFVLTTLLVTLLAAALTQFFGLSMALGAFLAGMMLGESQYKYQLEADIRPFRDILLGLFFVTVGMKLDWQALLQSPGSIALVLLLSLLIKISVIRILGVRAGESAKDSWAAGFMLAQMGEFSFVLIAMAANNGVFSTELTSILLGAGILSMAITPFMITHARSWAVKLTVENHQAQDNEELTQPQQEMSEHVVICGFGRVGQTVSRFLKQENINFIAIDIDPVRVTEAREAGENVLFGSARQAEVLHAANIEQAKLVVVSYGEPEQSFDVVQKVRSLSEHVQILVRTRNDDALTKLQEAGATEVVPESLEGSLMLVSQVLNLSGVPFSRIVRQIRAERKNHYNRLHGFYPGVDTDMSAGAIERLEFVHATLLNDDAFATGKRIDTLKLSEKRVEILAIRRRGQEIPHPPGDEVLMAQDTLVLQGKPRRVERVERFLQKGE